MLAKIVLLFMLIAATWSQQLHTIPFRQSLAVPDVPSSPVSSTSFATSTSSASHASPTNTNQDKGTDAWKTGHPERDWHKTCLPCYGNAGLVDGHLLQLGCSENNRTFYDDFKSFNELDLGLCLTNNDGVINNFDNNTLKPITGHKPHPNGYFSRNCNCYLQWDFLNGSLMCRCGIEPVKNQALNTIWVFDDALDNDNGNVSCKLGEEKKYVRKMDGCPKLAALRKQPGD